MGWREVGLMALWFEGRVEVLEAFVLDCKYR